MGFLGVPALEEEAFLAGEDGVAGFIAEEIAALVADDGGGDERGNKSDNAEVGFARGAFGGGGDACDEEHGVAGQKEADEEAGLGEDDGGDERHASRVDEPPACRPGRRDS